MSEKSRNRDETSAGRVKVLRRTIGLTQEGLARELNVTFSTVNRWENGHVEPSHLAWKVLGQLAAERGVTTGGARQVHAHSA